MALPTSKFYGTKDIAALFNISVKTVPLWETQGIIPKASINSGRLKRWPKAVIDQHVRQMEEQANQDLLQA
jgi:DNA-binding transcriptional MerR regulator